MRKPDSRFTFEKGKCPFKANLIPDVCDGNNCEIWMVEKEQGRDLGCAIRIGTEAARTQAESYRYICINGERAADALKAIEKTMLQILGQLKTRK